MKRFLESNWSQIAPKLKQRYGLNRTADLEWPSGLEQRFIKKLSSQLEMSQDELLKEMKELITD